MGKPSREIRESVSLAPELLAQLHVVEVVDDLVPVGLDHVAGAERLLLGLGVDLERWWGRGKGVKRVSVCGLLVVERRKRRALLPPLVSRGGTTSKPGLGRGPGNVNGSMILHARVQYVSSCRIFVVGLLSIKGGKKRTLGSSAAGAASGVAAG